METIYLYNEYIHLYRISWCLILTGLYGVYNSHYILTIAQFLIGFTSLNHWRYPIQSYRRMIDLVCVKSMAFYKIYMIQDAEYLTLYKTIFLCVSIIYLFGYYQYNYANNRKVSLYAHLLVHILSNIGCIILYSGNITTIL
jgi:hypothetical protein